MGGREPGDGGWVWKGARGRSDEEMMRGRVGAGVEEGRGVEEGNE